MGRATETCGRKSVSAVESDEECLLAASDCNDGAESDARRGRSSITSFWRSMRNSPSFCISPSSVVTVSRVAPIMEAKS